MKVFAFMRGSVMTLMTGTALAQLIMFALSPVLTRLYSPAAFGQYAMLSLALSLLVVFSTGKYEIAVLLPKSDKDAWAIVFLAGAITIGVVIVSCFIGATFLLSFGRPWLTNLGVTSREHFISLIALSGAMIFLSGWQAILFSWMNRRGTYREISTSRVAQAIVMMTTQIALSYSFGGLFGLLLGTIAGLLSCLLLQAYFVLRIDRKDFPTLIDMKRLAREHSNLPRHMIPTNLIGSLLAQLPIYFLGSRYSEATVGFYSLAQRTLLAPMQLIANSVGEVFRRQAAAEYAQKGECADYFRRTALILSAIAVILVGITIAFGPDLFAFIFGEQWRTAGEFSTVMIVMYAFKFVVSPLSFMFVIAKKTRLDAALHLIFLILLVGASNMIDLRDASVMSLLIVFVSIYSIMYMIYFLLSRSYAYGKAKE